MTERMTFFGKEYEMEPRNLLVEMFRAWQQRFTCPKCKTPTMDFILSDKIDKPIICTKCHTLFSFVNSSQKRELEK